MSRGDMTWEELKEYTNALKEDLKNNLITVDFFRRALAKHGFNATEIEEELKSGQV